LRVSLSSRRRHRHTYKAANGVVLLDGFFSRWADRFSLFVSFAGFLDPLLDRCDLDIRFLLLDRVPEPQLALWLQLANLVACG
jgi:hypothetical protein